MYPTCPPNILDAPAHSNLWLTSKELAYILGLSPGTPKVYRHRGGPPGWPAPVKSGGRYYYHISALHQYLSRLPPHKQQRLRTHLQKESPPPW